MYQSHRSLSHVVDMIKSLHPIYQIWVFFYSCALFILTRSKLVVHQSVCTDQLNLLLLMAMLAPALPQLQLHLP